MCGCCCRGYVRCRCGYCGQRLCGFDRGGQQLCVDVVSVDMRDKVKWKCSYKMCSYDIVDWECVDVVVGVM